MPKIEISARMVGSLFALVLACAGLTACGGSSGSTSHSSANAARSLSTSGTTAPTSTATAPTRRALSQSTTSARIRNSKLLARLRALRASRAKAGGSVAQPTRQTQSTFRNALAQFATCLRQNGVKISAPNTSGKGPLLSTHGLNTNSPQYKAAVMKCRAVLLGAFRRATHQATKR